MDLNLSRAERDVLRYDLVQAKPYDEDDPILHTFDGEKKDMGRWRATMAQKLLEQDEKEKKIAGRPLEPENTPESERRRKISL